MKVDIKEELSKKRDASIESTKMDANVHELKMLIEGREVQEREILKEAGLDHNISKVENAMGINLERSRFEERINDNVFTYDEIKDVCLKYNLKFLPSQRYKGSIEPQLGAKILRFFEEKGIDSAKYEAHNNLFIMAPYEAFNLDELPVPPKMRKDPAIFYRMSGPRDTGTYYVMIHKWGNDFTVMRRIAGSIRKNKWNWAATMTALISSACLLILAGLGFNPLAWQSLLGSVTVAFLLMLINYGTSIGLTGDDTSTDTAKKYKFNLKFSEHGWNSAEK